MMRPYHKYILFFSVSFFCLMIFIAPGDSYVLQGPHLLDLMTANSGKAERIQVSQKLLVYDVNPMNRPAVIEETARYLFPDAFRSDTDVIAAKRIHVIAGNSAITVIDGQVVGQTETDYDHYKDIMLYPSRLLLGERLRFLGIDVTVTSLGRFQGKVTYILGAQYPNPSPPQLWIDRETFRPVRWLIKNDNRTDGNRRLEIRYVNWQQNQGIWYPMQVEFYEGEHLVREIRADQVKIDPPFAAGLFDVGRIRAMYQSTAVSVPEPVEPGGIGELQKTIEEFRKIYE